MNRAERLLITSIKSYLNNEKTDFSTFSSSDFKSAAEIAQKHNISNFFYYGIPDSQREKNVKKEHIKAVMQATSQTVEFDLIREALTESKIRFLGFKGITIRNIYKNPDARSMADIDIFIDEKSMPEIDKIMVELGYSFSHKTELHACYEKGMALSIEFHTRLFSEELGLYKKSAEDFWSFNSAVKSENNYEYSLSVEDEYIYMLAHSARHFYGAGMGIKMLIDIYSYNKFYSDMNKEYVNKNLEKFNLKSFEKSMVLLSEYWFGEGAAGGFEQDLGEWILRGAAFGTDKQLTAHSLAGLDSNLTVAEKKRKLQIVFPSASYLATYYPWLKSHKYLLPIAWVLRFFRLIFKKNINKKMSEKLDVSIDDAQKLAYFYKKLGLYKNT